MILKTANGQSDEMVFIDPADYPLTQGYTWKILRQRRDGYTRKYVLANVYDKKDWTAPKAIYLHRLLMLPGAGLVVDHISGNSLDNRRTNLRVATLSQNALNRTIGRARYGGRLYTPGSQLSSL